MTESKSQSYLVFIAMLIIFSTMGKVYLNATTELQKANDAATAGLRSDAVAHFERAIHWYFPGADAQDRAAEGLWSVANYYESSGDMENAINAYRILRGAFYATRSFFTPGRRWIDLCDDKIAHITALQEPYSAYDKEKSFEQRKKEALAVLTLDRSPYAFWAVVSEIGFIGWLACSFMLIFRALTPAGNILAKSAFFWGCGLVLFYIVWLTGLSKV